MPKKIYVKICYLLILTLLVTLPVLFRENGAIAVSGDGYIKWVDFNVTSEILRAAVKYDLESYEASNADSSVKHAGLVTLIALAAAKYGGEFKKCKTADIKAFAERLMAGEEAADIAVNKKNFAFYLEAYEAALGGVMGNYAVKDGGGYSKRYGVKVFSPIAAGYYYKDYDDFGASRAYGYKRSHLGHDIMGNVGTPIIAVESGYVEACGWNQYGGWRIGIRSYDGKRYYYYAHLRKGHPYNDIYEGKHISAGEVIGYLGMTGYSAKEDTNNISIPHLHFGIQLIFDESQKDGWNQIWIDLYEYTKFLSRLRAEVYYDGAAKEYYSKNAILDLDAPD